jgi:MoxR-like ATPase
MTVQGETRVLLDPFFVVATQNPHQFHGTYPLPEGQLDRFMVATTRGYLEWRSELHGAPLRSTSTELPGTPASR